MSYNEGIWHLPYKFEVIVLLITILLRVLVFSPRTWSWRRIVIGKMEKKEQKPLDKPSKYVVQREQDTIGGDGRSGSTSAQLPMPCLHDNAQIDSGNGGMEMKYQALRHGRAQSSSTQKEKSGTYEASVRTPHTSAKSISKSTSPSPINPFLFPPCHIQPTLNPRTCAQHLPQHTAFFSPPSPSQTISHSSFSSLSTPDPPPYDLNTSEIEALEAGTASLTPRTTLRRHEKSKSWVDLGIAKVEDTVNGLVGRVARWTDGDDEEGLLPVANGGRGVAVR
ncbi:hypothetical protein IQ06DRAFT_348589 [Phaeosphaeriaceae sp. SRC1lsM3a]|nr:hypothetical protein IQ06DRAFT_348589 [Stagonospora sp. SRC1lsM3a]